MLVLWPRRTTDRFKIRDFISGSVWLLASYHRAKKRINGPRKRTWPFPLWRLHSDHSHRSADQCPETPPEHQELSVADALRTSVVTGNYLQINSPWRPARTRGFPLYSHRCCLGHLAETPSAFGSSRQEAKMPRLKRICQRPGSIHKLSGQNAPTRT